MDPYETFGVKTIPFGGEAGGSSQQPRLSGRAPIVRRPKNGGMSCGDCEEMIRGVKKEVARGGWAEAAGRTPATPFSPGRGVFI
jgi:hypothetical protein